MKTLRGILLAVLAVGLAAGYTYAGSYWTSIAAGLNWSDANGWSKDGQPVDPNYDQPAAGDDANLASFRKIMNTVTIPASGSLASLRTNAEGNVALVASGTNAYSISSIIIQAGTCATGIVNCSGAASGSTIAVSGGVTGGTGTNAWGVFTSSSAPLTFAGSLTPGSTTSAYALRFGGAVGVPTIKNSIINCSATLGVPTIYDASNTGVSIVLDNTLVLDGAVGAPIFSVKAPTWIVDANTPSYHRALVKYNGAAVANMVFAFVDPNNVKLAVPIYGAVAGTYAPAAGGLPSEQLTRRPVRDSWAGMETFGTWTTSGILSAFILLQYRSLRRRKHA